MSGINILKQDLINLIAAGEVVERPASAVKELLENAIDSGATEIIVNIEDTGKKLIEVIDNGEGIDFEDADKVLLQHATSKISTKENLSQIKTMGFRGEALASISEVSLNTVIKSRSKTHDGLQILKTAGIDEVSHLKKPSKGTQVSISGLFQNIPARLKFLKKDTTELRQILDTFISTALPFNNVYFELNHNGKSLYKLPAVRNFLDRIYEVSNKDVSANLIAKDLDLPELKIEGYIGNTQSGSKSDKYQYLYINNRYIKSGLISAAVKQAYTGFLHRDLKPNYFLFLTLDPSKFDINVHPRKLEVKFENDKLIFSTIFNFVKKTLETQSREAVQSALDNSEGLRSYNLRETLNDRPTLNNTKVNNSSYSDRTVRTALNFTSNLYDSKDKRNISVVNDMPLTENYLQERESRSYIQVFDTYIVYAKDNMLNFIDQHAAAEKIAFEKIIKNIGKVETKPLLIPEIYEFKNDVEKREVLESKSELDSIGFVIDDFGGKTIQISEIPEVLSIADFESIVSEFFETSEKLGVAINSNLLKDFNISESLYLKIATIACHGSIRAGQKLKQEEMAQIVNDLMALEDPGNCPHGRPTMWQVKKSFIEKNFNRDI